MSDIQNDRPCTEGTPEANATREKEDVAAPEDAISLDQLSEAFAAMLRTDDASEAPAAPASNDDPAGRPTTRKSGAPSTSTPCDITPSNILEAMLFVGRPDNEPLLREELASVMRDIRPTEIDQLVQQLNNRYDAEGTPYRIVSRGAGYQLQLRDAFQSVRNRFYGRTRRARLSRAAIEVLAVVAYRQPVTANRVKELRGAASGAILSQLVRRQLIALSRLEEDPRVCEYTTTDRFLRLFGLGSIEELPGCEDPEGSL
ncbi:MAG: SMC-Scp complex subunit ScpB [Pirellulales bacterium]